ncbi:putative endoplasmic reticulum membrane protein [Golovinomyces cichoracearum]|uniref:Putative endoplasmic reticulum membrane protein n=1 Tax=Golovinomyces cichoracearum TaxID=62708 RepID=A0A420J857_9PEZI|nr:putative endoplasmic reticulum membrane protein [Golovinomyces cichoracearum]
MSLDLEKQLCFYGAYHNNPVNVGIHMTFVPLILAATLTLATNTPVLINLPEKIIVPYLPLNLGTIIAILYGIFYMLLEPVAGTALFPILLSWAAYSNHLTKTIPSLSNKIAIFVEIIAWIAQFLGHGLFEGRAPALLDNLVQALVLAPFFVFMEILFRLGYRPELQKRINTAVEKEIRKFKITKAAQSKKSC